MLSSAKEKMIGDLTMDIKRLMTGCAKIESPFTNEYKINDLFKWNLNDSKIKFNGIPPSNTILKSKTDGLKILGLWSLYHEQVEKMDAAKNLNQNLKSYVFRMPSPVKIWRVESETIAWIQND